MGWPEPCFAALIPCRDKGPGELREKQPHEVGSEHGASLCPAPCGLVQAPCHEERLLGQSPALPTLLGKGGERRGAGSWAQGGEMLLDASCPAGGAPRVGSFSPAAPHQTHPAGLETGPRKLTQSWQLWGLITGSQTCEVSFPNPAPGRAGRRSYKYPRAPTEDTAKIPG